MSALLIALAALVGGLFSVWLLPRVGLVERVASVLLFAMAGIPLLVTQLCLASATPIDSGLVAASGLALVGLLAAPGIAWARAWRPRRPGLGELAVLAVAASVALWAWLYYTNTEFLVSLASYLQRGEAKCFYMQTFKLLEALNPGQVGERVREMYTIISTPGNAAFTAGWMPALGPHSFAALYAGFSVLLFLYVFLLMSLWTSRRWLAVLVGLFALLHPYALFVEVLDRNAMAYALSAALFHVVLARPRAFLLHGLVFGATAGLGLRFLPLSFALPILLVYLRRRVPLRAYGAFVAGGAASFLFNLPHLSHHGFHSMGESESFPLQLLRALSAWQRTPFLPYPNAVFYAYLALGALGCLGAGLAALGLWRHWRRGRGPGAFLLLAFLPTYLVLCAQRDWLEADKARILLSAFLPLVLLLGLGLAALLRRPCWRSNLVFWGLASVAIWALAAWGGRLDGGVYEGFYERRGLYQHETPVYLALCRRQLATPGALPDYGRLIHKLDLRRKQREEAVVAQRLFGSDSGVEAPWLERWLPPEQVAEPPAASLSQDFVDLRIDLELLASAPAAAVSLVQGDEKPLADLQRPERLLGLYHKEVQVSWQQELLPVTVLTGELELSDEQRALGELYVELNSFISYGKDEQGWLEKVNLLHHLADPQQRQLAYASAMTALPQRDQRAAIVLRIPREMRVIVRNWYLKASGAPHRVDGWFIQLSPDGVPTAAFHPLEPESYL